MNRGTPEERRWESGLRQGARTSDVSESMKSQAVHRRSALRRPQTETTKRGEDRIIPPPLAATAALQAYLSNDIDARSRIPCPRPVAASGEKKVEKTTLSPSKRHNLEKTTQPRVSVHAAPIVTSAASQSESPLSRFQKHMKESGMNRYPSPASHQAQSPHCINVQGRDFSTPKRLATGSSQTLTRSLIDKIREAKRLRHAEVVHGTRHNIETKSSVACTVPGRCLAGPVVSTDVQTKCSSLALQEQSSPSRAYQSTSPSPEPIKVSTSSPPVPHAKPIKPVISLSPSRPTSAKLLVQEYQDGRLKQLAKEHETKMSSSVNTIIEVTNAVLLIQRMWRGGRLIRGARWRQCKGRGQQPSRPEHAEVTVVVDRDFGVKPLFATVKMNRKVAQTEQQDTKESDLSDGCDPMLDENKGVITCKQYPEDRGSNHTSDPWTDHELVFLEEGRCIGELQESVRKGICMDDDELVWKHPQQIIQRLEAARAISLQKTRRKWPISHQLHYQSDQNVNTEQSFVPATMLESSRDVLPRSRGKHVTIAVRKRKSCRVSSLKRRSRNKVAVACRASESRRVFVHVQRANDSRPEHSNGGPISTATQDGMRREAPTKDLQGSENQPDCGESATEQAGNASSVMDELEPQADHNLTGREETEGPSSSLKLDQFVVFSGFVEATSGVNTVCSRNDLISVGDLALARSLLYDRDHGQTANSLGEYSGDFIPLTLSTPPGPVQSSKQSMEPGNEPSTEPTQVATGCSDDYEDDNQTDHNFSDADGDDVKNCGQSIDVQLFGRLVEDPEVFALPAYPWTWDDVLPRKEGHRDDGVSLASSASSSPGTNSARSEVFERQVEVDTGSRHCSQSSSADPMRTLEVVKTAVTTTMARIHSAYQDASAPDEQQLEIPSSAAATSAAVSAIRVDEAKRLEFLRALDDFKRCLRPTSSSSSLVSGA